MTTIEELWTYACNGDIESLEKSYANGYGINNRYFKFGESHSLIMGAFRNNEYDTVEYLLEQGEELTQKEYEEIQNEVRRLEVMRKMIK